MVNKNEILQDRDKNILFEIYENLYKKLSNNHTDIFLCGKNLREPSPNIRGDIYENLKNDENLMIFFPEKVFSEYFNINKDADYLELENLLAENVDFVCIVCESVGAFVELGAFANSPNLKEKLIILNDKNFKDELSFINMGPIKHLKKFNKNSVIYYDDEADINKICKNLKSKFKANLKENDPPKAIDKITGMFYFISILLYFLGKLNKNKLRVFVKYVVDNLEKKNESFDFLATYNATEKSLFNFKFVKNINNNSLGITDLGKKFVFDLIHKKTKSIYNKVISDIIKYKYYHYSS